MPCLKGQPWVQDYRPAAHTGSGRGVDRYAGRRCGAPPVAPHRPAFRGSPVSLRQAEMGRLAAAGLVLLALPADRPGQCFGLLHEPVC